MHEILAPCKLPKAYYELTASQGDNDGGGGIWLFK